MLICTELFRRILFALLDDDQGISTLAFNQLKLLAEGTTGDDGKYQLRQILNCCDSADGRYYIRKAPLASLKSRFGWE